MAATGIGNPVGCVQLTDGGAPRIISGYARTNISGGVLVYCSGAADVISSGTNSFADTDIKFTIDASGAKFNGVALADTGSNTLLSVITRGWLILTANGTVTAGTPVVCDGNNAVADIGSTSSSILHDNRIGRAITEATSGGYAIIDIWG